MLRDLHWTYWQYAIGQGISVLIQFGTMHRWGIVADRYGNRLVMWVTAYPPAHTSDNVGFSAGIIITCYS